jgi:hypothetical protein
VSLCLGLSLCVHLPGAISSNRVLQVVGISCAFVAGSALSVLIALLAWNAGLLFIVVNGIVERLCRFVGLIVGRFVGGQSLASQHATDLSHTEFVGYVSSCVLVVRADPGGGTPGPAVVSL